MGLLNVIQHGWNTFRNRDPTPRGCDYSPSYSYRPDRLRLSKGKERSIITSVYNRIALDVAAITIKHCQLDEDGRFQSEVNSKLNECLTLSANLDQTSRAFIQDVVMSMLDEGHVAIIPVDTTINPLITDSYDIESMRTGKIVEWRPKEVKVEVYDENDSNKKEIVIPKRVACIIENPFYAVMNERNSTLQRLNNKLALLDVTDERTASGKLDLIIQLPYVVKSKARMDQAERRRKDIEMQLTGSKYGIAYTDGTEKITQLNRPVENDLMKQVEYLTNFLFSQLGMTQSILDGTADDKTMLNYYSRTIEPIVSAITDEMNRKFLTKTARTQHKAIRFFRNPFKLVPVNDIAEIADKLTRNEIMSSNEIRTEALGMKPSKDPKADQLINSNINHGNSPDSNRPPDQDDTMDQPSNN